MATNEILIGRRVANGYTVPDMFNRVSRIHAKIYRNDNGIFIEDLDSSNGTYINGARVVNKQISTTDRISLGGANHFILNIPEILKMLPMSDAEFSKRFLELQYVYEDYQAESTELQNGGQENMMLKRMLPTTLLGALTAIASAIAGPGSQVIVGIGGGILTVIVFIFANKWASSSNRQNKERLNKLNEQFELNYVCPSCNASLRGRSWEFLRRAGKCPFCNRKFKA